jgi:hypothetical protein
MASAGSVKSKSVREHKIEAELVRRVELKGGVAEKVTVLGRRGFFDRLITLPGGRVIFCEVKRPRGGRLSAHQIKRIEIYKTLGAEVVVVKNISDIDNLLES